MAHSVLVTGGNRGIGLAVARAFVENGDKVAVTHRGSPPPGDIFGVRCDVTYADQVEAAFKQVEDAHGPVEILVSNAGVTDDTLLLRMSEERFTSVLDTNLTGAFRVARRAARSMLRGRWGRVILMSSVAGMSGTAGQVNYAASKSGMIGMARSMAREFGTRGITVNVVAPGLVLTDMAKKLSEERRREMCAAIPLGRHGTVEEVASTVRWLASKEAGYVTGAVIPVDGGLGMGH
ncbi:3-oxoacyl-ACP reductase FabG [Streptomyces sp. CSDS2]|uniref:3-oxoacyl-ACP reductase FabG n=1 Tax=Streptomyces sp. CSDS2 TaxID=3055051 RepID=UPI0025B25A48|nr:3-oxoacyl-ACP reductase FabG [Streptomyces sp. CSDS2]MDN3259823.1 3-oxoacyl-ACP reductase FabG [Streptomyces sp. CSDS2]